MVFDYSGFGSLVLRVVDIGHVFNVFIHIVTVFIIKEQLRRPNQMVYLILASISALHLVSKSFPFDASRGVLRSEQVVTVDLAVVASCGCVFPDYSSLVDLGKFFLRRSLGHLLHRLCHNSILYAICHWKHRWLLVWTF